MSKRRIAVVCALFLLLSLCSCSEQAAEVHSTSVPTATLAPEEVPVPKPSDPMDGVYPVTSPEDAAEILKQAYEGMIPQLTFAFPMRNCLCRTGLFSCKMRPVRF